MRQKGLTILRAGFQENVSEKADRWESKGMFYRKSGDKNPGTTSFADLRGLRKKGEKPDVPH